MTENYTSPEGIPLEPIRPGTTVLVAGSRHDGSRELCLTLGAGGHDEGSIFVTTNAGASRLIDDCETLGAQFTPETAGVIDCVSDDVETPFPARVLSVSSPRDLTGIGIQYSQLYSELHEAGVKRVRSSMVSITTLLSLGDLQQVSRFVHTLAGRIEAVDGIGFFLIDPTTQDERAVSTISQFCDARIDVRDEGDGPELRARGIRNQPRSWSSFEIPM